MTKHNFCSRKKKSNNGKYESFTHPSRFIEKKNITKDEMFVFLKNLLTCVYINCREFNMQL